MCKNLWRLYENLLLPKKMFEERQKNEKRKFLVLDRILFEDLIVRFDFVLSFFGLTSEWRERDE